MYGELCRTTLAKIILFNQRHGGEVAKMPLKGFLERDTAALHKDVALGLRKFEQKLCKHFSRVELRGKRGRKVAVLLSSDIVDSLTLLINKRKDCGIPEGNIFLFARPHCLTPYREWDCLSVVWCSEPRTSQVNSVAETCCNFVTGSEPQKPWARSSCWLPRPWYSCSQRILQASRGYNPAGQNFKTTSCHGEWIHFQSSRQNTWRHWDWRYCFLS